jgi:hypothetical protein
MSLQPTFGRSATHRKLEVSSRVKLAGLLHSLPGCYFLSLGIAALVIAARHS